MQSGKVRFEYRDLAFLGEESVQAAEAAACAADQGAFWRYHNTLFANQEGENQGAFSGDRLERMAEAIDLEMNAFTSCVDRRAHQEEVAAMTTEAHESGVAQTPTLVVDGRAMPFRGYDDLAAAIEAALAGG